MRKYTFLYLLFALLTQCALGKDLRGELEGQMQMQMQFQGKSFVLSLENNATAKDFYALLPLCPDCMFRNRGVMELCIIFGSVAAVFQ